MTGSDPIAIVASACRLPGAGTPEAYWRLLVDGVDAVGAMPETRWDVDAFYDPDPAAPGRMATRWGGYLDQVDGFDAAFFGMSPREAVERSEEHTSEPQSLMRISYAVFCLKKKTRAKNRQQRQNDEATK